jgi:hypothetical protein
MKYNEMRGACSTHGRNSSGNLKETYHSEDQDVDGSIILEPVLGKYGGKVWNGFTWIRIRTSGGPL